MSAVLVLNRKKRSGFLWCFALGAAITFTVLGSLPQAWATAWHRRKWWYIVLGALMVLMALQTWA
jgi:hypothetical protein